MRAILMVALVAAMSFAGCLVNDDSSEPGGAGGHDDSFDDEQLGFDSSEGPSGQPASGTAASHGDPTIEEGPVTTAAPGQGSTHWQALQTITIDNDFGGAAKAAVAIQIAPGSIDVRPSPDGDYHYSLQLVGLGGTEAEAEEALNEIQWGHEDELNDGTLFLQTQADRPGTSGISCTGILVPTCSGKSWRAHLVAEVPDTPSYDLDISASSADVTVTGLRGSEIDIGTSSGDITISDLAFAFAVLEASSGDTQAESNSFSSFASTASSGDLIASDLEAKTVSLDRSSGDVSIQRIASETLDHQGSSGDIDLIGGIVETLQVETSSGDQTYDLRMHTAVLDSSSGTIQGELDPQATGRVDATASSGDIELDFPADGQHGYDVRATTSSGSLDIDVRGADDTDDDEDRFHATTPGFSGRAVRTTLQLQTSSGDVTVNA